MKGRSVKRRRLRRANILIAFGSLVLVLALAFLGKFLLLRFRYQASNKRLLASKPLMQELETCPQSSSSAQEERRFWYEEQRMKAEYEDLAGWISVPELAIETPLFAKEDDYWFYTNHNRLGEWTEEGEAGIVVGNRNVIVWDHAFIDGTRFHKLANWPDNQGEMPLEVWLEMSDGGIQNYELIASRYISDDSFFEWDFPTEEHWHEYLKNVVNLTQQEKPESLLTIYTCHTHDASVKSVLWFIEAKQDE